MFWIKIENIYFNLITISLHVNTWVQIEKEVQLYGVCLLVLLLLLQPVFLNFLLYHYESGSNVDVLKVVLCPPSFLSHQWALLCEL